MRGSARARLGFSRAESEKQNKVFRRSLYFTNNLNKGQIICEGDIRRIRPGYGIMPNYYDEVIGKRVTRAVDLGEAVSWDVLELND